MTKLKVGVAGVGHLGRLHAALYKQVAGAELIGVYDLEQQRAQAVAVETGCLAFPTFPALLAEVDAVNLAVPTTAHFELAAAALYAHKHIFIEKPITTSVAEADELIQLARQNGCVVQVGHIERFNQAVRALRAVAVAPMFIESHRLATFNPRGTDVPVVLDLMIHDLDIILSLVPQPIERIDANGVAVVSAGPDIANARITFRNGCVANITASRISQKKMRKMRLFEKDSYLSVDLLQGLTERYRLVSELPAKESGPGMVMGKLAGEKTGYIFYEQLTAPDGNALLMELEAFAAALRGNHRPPVTAEEGRKALAVASRISEIISQQENSYLS